MTVAMATANIYPKMTKNGHNSSGMIFIFAGAAVFIPRIINMLESLNGLFIGAIIFHAFMNIAMVVVKIYLKMAEICICYWTNMIVMSKQLVICRKFNMLEF